jgi:hypothetical protein
MLSANATTMALTAILNNRAVSPEQKKPGKP